jgi:hypothetical protein
MEKKFVVKEGNRYLGQESRAVRIDPGREGAETWYDKVCNLKFYLASPECPLSKKQLAVYYLKLQGKSSTSLIAGLLPVSRQTVISAVRALKQHGSLDAVGDPVTVPEGKLNWWRDKPGVHNQSGGDLDYLSEHFAPMIAHFKRQRADWIALHSWKAELDRFGSLCKRFGYSFRKVVGLLLKAGKGLSWETASVARVFRELPRLVQKAGQRTQANRRRNVYQDRSSFGMLVCKLNDLVRAEKARR